MSSGPGTSYSFERVGTSRERIRQYASFLSSAFPDKHKYSAAYLEWQYLLNPNGPVVGFDAWDGEDLAAHYVALPATYAIDGKLTSGLLSVNTATRPDHHGRGLFTELASRTYELAAELGPAFVIGVSNENSTHGFTARLGFHLISPLDVKVGCGVFRTGPPEHYRLRAAWSPEALRWRLRKPSHAYARRGGELHTDAGRFGISAVVALGERLGVGEVGGAPFAPFKVWIGIDRQLRSRGVFVGLPRRMRPSPLNCIFKDLVGDLPVFEKDDVRFELIDFDAY